MQVGKNLADNAKSRVNIVRAEEYPRNRYVGESYCPTENLHIYCVGNFIETSVAGELMDCQTNTVQDSPQHEHTDAPCHSPATIIVMKVFR